MAYKIIIRYFATLIPIVLVGGALLHALTPVLVYDDNSNLKSSIGFAFVFIFITYNIYLGFRLLSPKTKNASLFIQGLFCFLLENFLWFIVLASLAGFNFGQFILNMLGAGVISYFIPFLHIFLDQRLGLSNNSM